MEPWCFNLFQRCIAFYRASKQGIPETITGKNLVRMSVGNLMRCAREISQRDVDTF